MADIGGFEVPYENLFGGFSGASISIILVILLFCIAGAVAFYVIYMRMVYKYKVVLFEDVYGNKRFEPTYRDTARLIKLGDGGEEIIFLRKKKQYMSAYNLKMGKNTLWFARSKDGFYYNFTLGDFDEKIGMLDIEPADIHMRYTNTALRKNIMDRTRSKKMDRAVMITMGGLAITVLIMLIGWWFLLDKMVEVSASTNAGVETSKVVVEKVGQVVGSLDNICGGSGFTSG